MKKLLSSLISISLLASLTTFTFAKTGSGGQPATSTPIVAPAPEPEPTQTPAPTPAPTPAKTSTAPSETTGTISTSPTPATIAPTPTPIPVATPAPAVEKSVTPPVKVVPKATPVKIPVVAEKKHCGMEKTVADRVKCRLNADDATINLEYTTAYFPEGCRWGSKEWQEKCKTRYKAIGPCWYDYSLSVETYDREKVMGCIRQKLTLPVTLSGANEYCKDKPETCREDYRKSIHHLIVARFYDAEERAELLLDAGKITKEEAIAFISFISQAKVDFYDAKDKAGRVKVIQSVIDNWKNLVLKVQN